MTLGCLAHRPCKAQDEFTMPKPCRETQLALAAIPDAKTHRAKCLALGLDTSWRGTIGRIIYGHPVSRDKENTVRHRLGLPPVGQSAPRHSRRRYYRPCLSLELRDELERRGADAETLLWLALAVGVEETQIVTTTASSIDPEPRTGTDTAVGTPALAIEGTSALTVAVMVGVP